MTKDQFQKMANGFDFSQFQDLGKAVQTVLDNWEGRDHEDTRFFTIVQFHNDNWGGNGNNADRDERRRMNKMVRKFQKQYREENPDADMTNF